MKHTAFWSWSPLMLLGLLSLPACGQQDTPEAVMADCSGRIPHEKIESCLERVRVLGETNPSPEAQALEAQLESRAHRRELAEGPANGPPRPPGPYQGRPPGYEPYGGPPPGSASDQEPPPGYDQNNQAPPSGYDRNDQGPPPDEAPPPDSRMGDVSPPEEGQRGDVSPPDDQTGPGDVDPPEDQAQGPPPDNTPPPDDSDTQGPGQ
jgi:hypothetical protein